MAGAVSVTTDGRRSCLAPLVPCRALGAGPRPSSTHGTHKLGLIGYTEAEYIFHLNGLKTYGTECNKSMSLLQPGEC